jgi:hypothetical protein
MPEVGGGIPGAIRLTLHAIPTGEGNLESVGARLDHNQRIPGID